MKRNRENGPVSARFSFIDILFSTIGTIIFIIAINLIFLASYAGLMSDADSQMDQIEKTSSIFTPRRERYDIYGSPVWLNPVLIILDNDQPVAKSSSVETFRDFEGLKDFTRNLLKLNYIYSTRGIRKRYSLIVGLQYGTYEMADEFFNYINIMEMGLEEKYEDHFVPVNISKIPIIMEELDKLDKIWEETEIEQTH